MQYEHISGLKELQEALKQLPQNIARNVLRGAVSAGAALVRDEAKRNAPVRHLEALGLYQANP